MLIIFAALLLSLSLAISLAISIPLIGTLIRFRANYSPKSVHLDQDGGLEPHVGPVVTSYWAMFKRVKRIEVGICNFDSYISFILISFIVREYRVITKD